MTRTTLLLSTTLLASAAYADTPSVAVDILPVHSLVAQVMDGVGEPDLIIPSGASPHGYSLRPSEARALSNADAVFWIGESLSPWLEDPIETLAADAMHVTLLRESDELVVIEFDDGHDDHHDDHGEDGHDDHDDHDDHDEHKDHDDHDDHGDEKHDEHDEEGHDDHDHEEKHEEARHEGHDHHDHGDFDPHGWLEPDNAKVWVAEIAAVLSDIDPDNAATYAANAEKAMASIDGAAVQAAETLSGVDGTYIVQHDAYTYFGQRYDVPAAAAVTPTDATEAGPAKIVELQELVASTGATCYVAEVPFDEDFLVTLFGDTPVKSDVIDPLGSEYDQGPDLYTNLITGMADRLAACLS